MCVVLYILLLYALYTAINVIVLSLNSKGFFDEIKKKSCLLYLPTYLLIVVFFHSCTVSIKLVLFSFSLQKSVVQSVRDETS